jgi:hypothetical protein
VNTSGNSSCYKNGVIADLRGGAYGGGKKINADSNRERPLTAKQVAGFVQVGSSAH